VRRNDIGKQVAVRAADRMRVVQMAPEVPAFSRPEAADGEAAQ
jgi:hypothetical protein